MKKYRVTLTHDERQQLTDRIRVGKASATRLTHARILLKADQADGGPGWTDEQIAEAIEVHVTTIERIRQRFVEEGFEAALIRKRESRVRERTLDGRAEAQLIALACSAAPEGRVRWTMQLLADRLIELKVVETISDETVRRTLKKTRSSRG